MVWREHTLFLRYSLDSFHSALNKAKKKYQFHARPMKEAPPKVDVEVIKNVTMMSLSSSVVGTADGSCEDQEKAMCCVCNMLSNVFWLTNKLLFYVSA